MNTERQFGARETATTRSLYTSLNQCYQTLAEVMALQGDVAGDAASMDALQAQWHVIQAELMVSLQAALTSASTQSRLRSKCKLRNGSASIVCLQQVNGQLR